MSRKQREKAIDLLNLKPALQKWVNQCGGCQTRGIKTETPEDHPDLVTLRKQLGVMELDQFGLCRMCGKK